MSEELEIKDLPYEKMKLIAMLIIAIALFSLGSYKIYEKGFVEGASGICESIGFDLGYIEETDEYVCYDEDQDGLDFKEEFYYGS